jgi:hypothetical protein
MKHSVLLAVVMAPLMGCGADPPTLKTSCLKLPSRADLCMKPSPDEEIHPQSPSYRGGCRGNFVHFYAEDGALPPNKLPLRAIGKHWQLGERSLVLIPRDEEACTPDRLPLYKVLAETDKDMVDLCEGQKLDGDYGLQCSAKQLAALNESAIAVPGAWDEQTGKYVKQVDGKDVFTLACMSGVAAKSVLLGYKPWGKHNETSLEPYFEASVQALRAKYDRSKNTAHTCKGTHIEVIDREGLNIASKMSLDLEAAWTKDGPFCIGQPRYSACASAPAVKLLPPCAQYSIDPSRKSEWPEGVLLVTRSSAKHTEKCPSERRTCPSPG